jgi:hypothetical protein
MAAAVVGGAVVGGYVTSNAAGKAADAQREGTDKSIAEQARQFDITQENQKPYREAGQAALGKLVLENDVPLDARGIQLDPGYQFGLTQGQQAIDRKMAAAGGRVSGAALKAAAQYGTDYATSGYSAAYSRANQARTDRLNRLAALAGIGQTATQNVDAAGANKANATSALLTAAGNNSGAAAIAQGNIWANTGNQLAALYGRGAFGGSGISDAAVNQSHADGMAYINGQLG